jgi:hypothetical protein
MTNPTSNFGWQMPTSTDLVTDLPADFETFGQAVDTSLAELKGGTTGQVLSKTSNTDMDFTWVTSDDANAIQNTIVDAKGDLIAASASDTPARLAVGANDTMLVADSTAATGLAYKSATDLYPWQTWTPTYTNISVGNGTVTARYQQVGKTVNVEFQLTFGSTTTISAPARISTPVTARMSGNITFLATFLDSGTAEYIGLANNPNGDLFEFGAVNASATYAFSGSVQATIPFTWTTNDKISFRATYEAA